MIKHLVIHSDRRCPYVKRAFKRNKLRLRKHRNRQTSHYPNFSNLINKVTTSRLEFGSSYKLSKNIAFWLVVLLSTSCSEAPETQALDTQAQDTQATLSDTKAESAILFRDLDTDTKLNTDRVDAARLLAQATFGPKLDSIDRVKQLGIEGWVDDQFTRIGDSNLDYVRTNYPSDSRWTRFPRHRKWLIDAIDGQDQLRLRVAFAYSQIFVTSEVDQNLKLSPWGMANYYDILRENAFVNYRDLIEQVTLSPIMGMYLSMIQNAKGDPATNTRADENFAREIMQLFSIGLHELNLDGTTKNDASGRPIPAYTQADIEEYARVYTGWAFANADGWNSQPFSTSTNKIDPMRLYPEFHDDGAKNLLGGVYSPAGISAEEDLGIALDSLFNHANVGPFIGKQLIQRLVTSNPTPAYVARVASAFNNNGDGVRGDMQAVIRAILLDDEAREGYQNVPNFGKLREPLLRWTHLWRAFNVQRGTRSTFDQYNYPIPHIESDFNIMGQAVLSSPSVFNFFRPDFAPVGPVRNSEPKLVAPEAGIYTESVFLSNTNKISTLTQIFWQGGDYGNGLTSSYIDIAAEMQLALTPGALLDHLNLLLLSGQMSPGLRQLLLEHFQNFDSTENGRSQSVRDAINLIMASPEYLVQK